MAWQMPGQWNTGVPQMTPDMNMGSYSAEQWAAVQQQNWHQWSQWQQQYSQWQSQYGEKYAEQMQSIQGMGVMPPLPPASAAPPPAPPPPEKPPPPPHENNQPLFGQPNPVPAPVPQPQKPLTASSTNISIPPGDTGNTQKWSHATDARNESSQQAVNTEALKKLAEEERLFDIQFEKWEEEIEKWKRENVNHPDRQAYHEYEQKFETCRAQLLERRQVMNQKRARLLGQASAAAGNNPTVTGNTSTAGTPIKQTPNNIQNLHMQPESQKTATEQTSNQYQQHDHSQNNYMANKVLHQNFLNKPPPNYQDNSQYAQYNKNMQLQSGYNKSINNSNVPQSGYNRNNNNTDSRDRIETYYDSNSQNEDYSSSNTSHTNFLPGIDSAKGIPGLDLVPEDKPAQQKQPDVIDITDEIPKAGQLPPDYTNISKGINNILGDEKIMNILSMVRDQGVPASTVNNQGQFAQKPPYSNNADNYNVPPPNNQWDRNQNRSIEHHENAPSNLPFNQRGPGYSLDQSRDHNAQQYPPRRMNNDNENDWSPEPYNDRNAQFSGQNMRSRGPLLRPNIPPPRPLMHGVRGFQNDSQFPRGPPNGPRSAHPGGYPAGHSGGPPTGHPTGPRTGHPGGPSSGHPSGPPSGHPGGPPSGHPGGPLSGLLGGPPSGHPGGLPSGHPGGPPSVHPGGPPSGHPGGPPSGHLGGPLTGHPSGPRSVHPSGHTSGSLSGHSSGPPSGPPNGPPNGPSSGSLRGPPIGPPGGQAGPQRGQSDMRPMRPNVPPPRPLMECFPGQDNGNNYSMPPMQGRLEQEDENNYSRGPPDRPFNNKMVNPAMNKPPPPVPPPTRTWSDDPQIAPSIIVDYQHKPLRLKAREFIEPVHIFEYNHISKGGDNNKKLYERDAGELFVRKPRRFEPEDNFRDKRFGPDDTPRHHIQRDYERRYPRDDYREDHRDVRGPPRDEYDDRRRFEERPPREEYYDRRFDDRGPPPREEFDDRRRLEERHDDRRRDDRERYSRREDFSKDMMRRDDRERDRDDLGQRDRQRELRRDDSRNRSRSRDKDSRKRGRSKETTVSESLTIKKPKEAEKKTETPKHIVMIDDLLEPPGREMRPEKIVIILRGPPGSGKSYLAKLIRDREAEHGGTARIMSIDDYFMQEGEIEEKDPVTGKIVKKPSLKYEYEAKSEETYLNSLKRAFKRTLTDGYFNFLIYDTANETLRSYADIWNFARQNGFQVYICTMELDPQTCFKRNIHGRTLGDIQVIVTRFFETPDHHIQLDATTLLQSAAITDVQMEDIDDEVIMEDAQEPEDPEVESSFTSKWEKLDDAAQLARLDGTSKPLRTSQPSMEDYLQLDDWKPTTAKPGKKTVRWADIEESREQEKMRAIGFVVGQTDWNRMTDPTMGSGALTQTKYIERVKRN